MIQFFRETDSGDGFLYHYTSIETAKNFILKDKRLLLNTLQKANDPKDCKNWFLSAHTDNHSKYNIKYGLKVAEELKKVIRMTCFTQDAVPLTPKDKFIFDINQCGFNNPQMWHYYGAKSTGLCLIFDKKKLIDAFNKQYQDNSLSGAVQYIDRQMGHSNALTSYQYSPEAYELFGPLEFCKLHMKTQDHAKSLLFEKSTPWKAESEFRIVTFAKCTDETYLNIEGALQAICFGAFSTIEDIDSIKAFKSNNSFRGLSFGKVFWRNASPSYVEGYSEIKRRLESKVDFQ